MASLILELIDRDDLPCARDSRALNRRQAHSTAAEDRDRRARFDARSVEHRADAGGDAAADQRGAVERNLLGDFHQRVLMHEHVFRVGREVRELANHLALLREPRGVALGAAAPPPCSCIDSDGPTCNPRNSRRKRRGSRSRGRPV